MWNNTTALQNSDVTAHDAIHHVDQVLNDAYQGATNENLLYVLCVFFFIIEMWIMYSVPDVAMNWNFSLSKYDSSKKKFFINHWLEIWIECFVFWLQKLLHNIWQISISLHNYANKHTCSTDKLTKLPLHNQHSCSSIISLLSLP